MSAARLSAISANAGSGLLCLGVVTASGTSFGVIATAARLPAPMMAADGRNGQESSPRRVGGREHRTFDCHDCALP
jgi:hypothetical protein